VLSPPGATVHDFDWRISIAEVRDTGPFSVFEDIDRTMTILSGRLALAYADRAVELDADSAPFAFPGDVPCTGTPLEGPVTDLNVMTRRRRCSARVERLSALPRSSDAKRSVIVASTISAVEFNNDRVSLNAFDALLVESDAAIRLISGAGFRISLFGR
jgi:hypothetical protein